MSYDPIATRLVGVGTKRVCVSCATRFYDLMRAPPVCPKCGTEQPPEPPRAPPIRRGLRMRPMRAAPRAVAEEDAAPGTEAPLLDTDEDEAEEEAPDEEAAEDEEPKDEEPEI